MGKQPLAVLDCDAIINGKPGLDLLKFALLGKGLKKRDSMTVVSSPQLLVTRLVALFYRIACRNPCLVHCFILSPNAEGDAHGFHAILTKTYALLEAKGVKGTYSVVSSWQEGMTQAQKLLENTFDRVIFLQGDQEVRHGFYDVFFIAFSAYSKQEDLNPWLLYTPIMVEGDEKLLSNHAPSVRLLLGAAHAFGSLVASGAQSNYYTHFHSVDWTDYFSQQIASMVNFVVGILSIKYSFFPACSPCQTLSQDSRYQMMRVAPMTYPWVNHSHVKDKKALIVLSFSGKADGMYGSLQAIEKKTVCSLPVFKLVEKPLSLWIGIAENYQGVLEGLDQLIAACHAQTAFSRLIKKSHVNYHQTACSIAYRYVLVAYSHANLLQEALKMRDALQSMQAQGNLNDYQSFAGSYVALSPVMLSKSSRSQVAFVYPGMGSAYVGCARLLLMHDPELMTLLQKVLANRMDEVLAVSQIYPQYANASLLPKALYQQAETQLASQVYQLCGASMGFAWLYTYWLRHRLGVVPDMALGFSLGEFSMAASLGVWPEPGKFYDHLLAYPVMRDELGGAMPAVKRYWQDQGHTFCLKKHPIWKNALLKADCGLIKDVLPKFPGVYLMTMHTEKEVMIGGYTPHVDAMVKALQVRALPVPFRMAVHCPPAYAGLSALHQLLNLPTESPCTTLYSSADYQTFDPKYKQANHHLSRMFCEPVNFPRLVNQVYRDGARIFIEIGPRDTCSFWMRKILLNKPHVTIPLDMKMLSEDKCLHKAIAKIISYGIKLENFIH